VSRGNCEIVEKNRNDLGNVPVVGLPASIEIFAFSASLAVGTTSWKNVVAADAQDDIPVRW
jgi:hypothetical protein